ncbi:MAG: protein kinase [Polyangiaceae bacterium]
MPPSPANPPLKPGALVAGKYRLQKLLGRGAAGVVWSAINVTTSRKVALKLLIKPEPKLCERLLREARAAGALHHPNVIDIYDVTELSDGSPVLVLELLEGQTLQQLIDERAPLPSREVASIGRDVARALAVAHASGIVHRDLKPANIFLHDTGDDDPVVKVVDFGISKNLLTADRSLTETGMAVGSPAFMSPEQVRGERDLDGRTDLWALGVILYEMVAGKRMFDGRTHEVLTQVLVEPIRPLESRVPGVDPLLRDVIHGLLQRDVDRRFGAAEMVAERLSRVADAPKPPGALSSFPPHGAHDTVSLPVGGHDTVSPPAGGHDTISPPARAHDTVFPPVRVRDSVSPPARAHDTVSPPAGRGAHDTLSPSAPKKEAPERRSVPAPAGIAHDTLSPPGSSREAHDTTVVTPMSQTNKPVPKAYEDDDDDDEPTHVAPMALRAALAQQTVPKAYTDDEEDEEEQTRVAPDAVLTAAIRASRSTEQDDVDQNRIDTVRPPAPIEPPASHRKGRTPAELAGEPDTVRPKAGAAGPPSSNKASKGASPGLLRPLKSGLAAPNKPSQPAAKKAPPPAKVAIPAPPGSQDKAVPAPADKASSASPAAADKAPLAPVPKRKDIPPDPETPVSTGRPIDFANLPAKSKGPRVTVIGSGSEQEAAKAPADKADVSTPTAAAVQAAPSSEPAAAEPPSAAPATHAEGIAPQEESPEEASASVAAEAPAVADKASADKAVADKASAEKASADKASADKASPAGGLSAAKGEAAAGEAAREERTSAPVVKVPEAAREAMASEPGASREAMESASGAEVSAGDSRSKVLLGLSVAVMAAVVALVVWQLMR